MGSKLLNSCEPARPVNMNAASKVRLCAYLYAASFVPAFDKVSRISCSIQTIRLRLNFMGGCYKDNQDHKPPTTGDANNNHNQITCLKCNSFEATIFIDGDGGGRFCEDCFRNNLYGNFKLAVTSNAMISLLDKVLVTFSGGASSRFICTTNLNYFSHPSSPMPFQVIMNHLTSSDAVSSDNGWIYMIE
nr:cytoplasmic tRNA 2-thiolation protein 2 [Tanacetum cinerariifolium]